MDATSMNISILSRPPFVKVDGIVNMRTVGGFPTSSDPLKTIKPQVVFRSGDVSRLTEQGAAQLRSLGIRRVFDFRADSEIASYKTVTPHVDGIEFIRAPVSQKSSFDPDSLARRMKDFEMNTLDTFKIMYLEILESAGPAFETVYRNLIDRPNEPCLIHCTGGKDRTGLCIALLLMVLGANDEDIVKDYALTTVGLAVLPPAVVERFKEIPAYRENWTGFMAMASSDPETMTATLDMIRSRYGGAEGYLKQKTSLTDEDFTKFRSIFVVDRA